MRGEGIYTVYMQTVYILFQRRCSRQLGEVLTTGCSLDAPRAKPGFASGERLNSAVIFGSTQGIPAFFSWGELPYHIHCWFVLKRWSLERDLIISTRQIKHMPSIPPNITLIFFLCDVLWHILLFFHGLQWEEI